MKNGDVFCDIGAGTGIFTFEAAEITENTVYAVEISDKMLEFLLSKQKTHDAKNVCIIKDIKEIPPASCDVVLLCTVLHEIVDKTATLGSIKEIITQNGLLAVIEFHKKPTPMDPPLEHRLDTQQTTDALYKLGFKLNEKFDLGDNFYCMIFENEL